MEYFPTLTISFNDKCRQIYQSHGSYGKREDLLEDDVYPLKAGI